MVKWYSAYEVTRYPVNALTRDHAITLSGESALSRFIAVKWCRGAMVVWHRGSVATQQRGNVVAWQRGEVVSNYHGSNVPETIHAWSELEASTARASWKAASCELELQPKI